MHFSHTVVLLLVGVTNTKKSNSNKCPLPEDRTKTRGL